MVGTPGPLHGKTILITGASGFLGVHVAEALAGQGARLVLQDTGLKRPDLLAPAMGPGRATFVMGDLRTLDRSPALLNQLEQVDYVVHLAMSAPPAADSPEVLAGYRAANLPPLEQLLERLPATVKGICLASTLAVYGVGGLEPLTEAAVTQPLTAFAVVKLAMEDAVLEFAKRRGTPATLLRFGTVYGPGEPDAARAAPSCIRNMLVGQPPVIYGDGTDVHDYLFVKDAAHAVRLALERQGEAPGLYNIGSGHGWSTRAMAEAVQRLLHVSLPPKHMPARGPRQCLVANIGRARQNLGFSPQTPLEEGLRLEIEYQHAYLLAGAEGAWIDPFALFAPNGIFASNK